MTENAIPRNNIPHSIRIGSDSLMDTCGTSPEDEAPVDARGSPDDESVSNVVSIPPVSVLCRDPTLNPVEYFTAEGPTLRANGGCGGAADGGWTSKHN